MRRSGCGPRRRGEGRSALGSCPSRGSRTRRGARPWRRSACCRQARPRAAAATAGRSRPSLPVVRSPPRSVGRAPPRCAGWPRGCPATVGSLAGRAHVADHQAAGVTDVEDRRDAALAGPASDRRQQQHGPPPRQADTSRRQMVQPAVQRRDHVLDQPGSDRPRTSPFPRPSPPARSVHGSAPERSARRWMSKNSTMRRRASRADSSW